MNKKTDTAQIQKAFSLTTKYGILARAYFIYGCPKETPETIDETIALMKDIKPLSTIFYILDVFPGTDLYEQFKKRFNITDDIWLEQIEDILWFEYDPDLTKENILAWGKKLRNSFHKGLAGFSDAVKLSDDESMYPLHADFLSRLGMTFSHGDYSQINTIKDKNEIAGRLWQRALAYAPDHRAFWGLGMIRLKQQRFNDSIRILQEGIKYFPQSEQLGICMGVGLMNTGQYDRALSFLLKFQNSEQAVYYIAHCYKALGNTEHETAFAVKYRSMTRQKEIN